GRGWRLPPRAFPGARAHASPTCRSTPAASASSCPTWRTSARWSAWPAGCTRPRRFSVRCTADSSMSSSPTSWPRSGCSSWSAAGLGARSGPDQAARWLLRHRYGWSILGLSGCALSEQALHGRSEDEHAQRQRTADRYATHADEDHPDRRGRPRHRGGAEYLYTGPGLGPVERV